MRNVDRVKVEVEVGRETLSYELRQAGSASPQAGTRLMTGSKSPEFRALEEAALDKAVAIVDAWAKIPLNDRGYPANGFKPVEMTAAERTDAIIRLATFLIAQPPRLVAPHRHVHCADPESGCTV